MDGTVPQISPRQMTHRIESIRAHLKAMHILEDRDVDILIHRMEHRARTGQDIRWNDLADHFGYKRDAVRKRTLRAIEKLSKSGIKWPIPLDRDPSEIIAISEEPASLDGWNLLKAIRIRGIAIPSSITIAELFSRILLLVENSNQVSGTNGERTYPNRRAAHAIRQLLDIKTGVTDAQVYRAEVGSHTIRNETITAHWDHRVFSGNALVPLTDKELDHEKTTAFMPANLEGAR